jgi:hypothetical protein
MLIYKLDRRTKIGMRLVKSEDHPDTSGNFMMEEMADLKRTRYPMADGWRLDFEPLPDNVA